MISKNRGLQARQKSSDRNVRISKRIEELRVVVVLVVARDVHRVPAMILYFEEVRRHELSDFR